MSCNLKPICAALIVTAGVSAHAQTVPVAQCAATGPGVLACVGAAVVIHEATQAGNGKEPFGPNGEGMKIVNGAGDVLAKVFGWDGGSGSSRRSPDELAAERLERRMPR